MPGPLPWGHARATVAKRSFLDSCACRGPVHQEPGTRSLRHSAKALVSRGYEPYEDADGTIRLHNCPSTRIAARHRQLVCGANLAMLQSLTNQPWGGDPPVRAVLDPQPGAAVSR